MRENNELEKDFSYLFDDVLLNLKNILNSNTAVGSPIKIGDNKFVIPVSKINVGCLTGGARISNKIKKNIKEMPFSGGNGTGFSIIPVGLLTIVNDNISYIQCSQETSLNQDIINVISKSMNKILDKEKSEKVWLLI